MGRKRGVMVEKLDQVKLIEACKEHRLAQPSYSGNALIRRESDGAAVVLSTEGVGAQEVRPGMVSLDTEFFREWQYLPTAVVEACLTGVQVDLADHIRTFGSRLDVNHYHWYEWAKGQS